MKRGWLGRPQSLSPTKPSFTSGPEAQTLTPKPSTLNFEPLNPKPLEPSTLNPPRMKFVGQASQPLMAALKLISLGSLGGFRAWGAGFRVQCRSKLVLTPLQSGGSKRIQDFNCYYSMCQTWISFFQAHDKSRMPFCRPQGSKV